MSPRDSTADDQLQAYLDALLEQPGAVQSRPFAEPAAARIRLPLPSVAPPPAAVRSAVPSVLAPPAPAPAPTLAPAPALIATPIVSPALQTIEQREEAAQTASDPLAWAANGRPQWAQAPFDALLFTVG